MKLVKESKFKLNLQFFADGGDAGGQGDNGTGETGTEGQEGGEGNQEEGKKQPTFDDLLKGEGMQAEFDRRISKALATQKAKLEASQKQAIEDALTEAQKLAKMKDDEKKAYEDKKREVDYNKRMAELTARELKATAKETLVSEGLPVELAEVLNYQDADSCNKSIEAVKTAFQTAVSKAVNEKLKGKVTPKVGAGSSDLFDAQLRASMGLPTK